MCHGDIAEHKLDPARAEPVTQVVIIKSRAGKIFIEPTKPDQPLAPNRAAEEVRSGILPAAVEHPLRSVLLHREYAGEDNQIGVGDYRRGQLSDRLWIFVPALGILKDHDVAGGRTNTYVVGEGWITKLGG